MSCDTNSPSIAVLLKGLLEDSRRSGTPITKSQLAERTGVVPSAVTGWFNGQSPRDAQLDKISSIFSCGDPKRELEIRSLLYGAVGRSIENTQAAIDRARDRNGLINIGVVKYSKGVSEFFEHLACAFGDFCGFITNIQSVGFAELEDRLKGGEIDVGFGLWETPSRLRNLNFLGTPLTVGMAVLALDKDILSSKEQTPIINSENLAPIMHQDQAVYHFALDVFGIAKANIQECPYDSRILAHILLRSSQSREASVDSRVPTVITDELMALATAHEVIEMIVGERDAPSLMPSLYAARNGVAWHRAGRPVAGFPRYNVSVCTRRPIDQSQFRNSDAEWFAFIEDAWRIFLRGNMDFVSERVSDLIKKLRNEVDSIFEMISRFDIDPEYYGFNKNKILDDLIFPNASIEFHNSDIWNIILKNAQQIKD